MIQENRPWTDRDSDHHPQILIIGLGKMGQRLVIEAARSWKLSQSVEKKKIKVTVIDLNAEEKIRSLKNQNPRLDNLAEFRSINMDILSGDFDKAGELFRTEDSCNLDIAYICLDDETFSLQTGLRLNHQFRSHNLPIVMRMVESGGLALLLGDQSSQDDPDHFAKFKDL